MEHHFNVFNTFLAYMPSHIWDCWNKTIKYFLAIESNCSMKLCDYADKIIITFKILGQRKGLS